MYIDPRCIPRRAPSFCYCIGRRSLMHGIRDSNLARFPSRAVAGSIADACLPWRVLRRPQTLRLLRVRRLDLGVDIWISSSSSFNDTEADVISQFRCCLTMLPSKFPQSRRCACRIRPSQVWLARAASISTMASAAADNAAVQTAEWCLYVAVKASYSTQAAPETAWGAPRVGRRSTCERNRRKVNRSRGGAATHQPW